MKLVFKDSVTWYIPWLNYGWFKCMLMGHEFRPSIIKWTTCKSCHAFLNIENGRHNACPIVMLSLDIIKRRIGLASE